jgi:hypothetical protein
MSTPVPLFGARVGHHVRVHAREHGGEVFVEGAVGWIVRATEAVPDGSFWQGPDHGDGTASGPLRTAMYWPNRKSVFFALQLGFGSVPAATSAGFVPEEIGAGVEHRTTATSSWTTSDYLPR